MTGLFAFLGSLLAILGAIRFLLIVPIRVHQTTALYLSRAIREQNLKRFMLSEEFGSRDNDQLQDTRMVVRIPGAGFVHIAFSERMMQAGFAGKDTVCSVHCLRWQTAGVRRFLESLEQARRSGERTPVELVCSWGMEPLGFLADVDEPYLEREAYADIDAAVARCAKGEGRTGIILHGPPGCGKTSLVKWLARRHRMPIRLFMFTPDLDNAKLTRMFAQLPPRSLVLFEDFDSHFDGRQCVSAVTVAHQDGAPTAAQPSCGATFDALLNGFDGVYNSYDGVVFVLTANDLAKIDPALSCRPSRFRYVREIPFPGEAVRWRVFAGKRDDAPPCLSLDELLAWQDNGHVE